MRKSKVHVIVLIISILLIPLIVFVSSSFKKQLNIPSFYSQKCEEGIVRKILEEDIHEDPVVEGLQVGRQVVVVEVKTGAYQGELKEVINTIDQGHNVLTVEGMKVILGVTENDDGPSFWIYSHKRSSALYVLIALFVGVLIFYGGKNGLYALVALLFTATMFIFVLVPSIFFGINPIIMTIICAVISTIVSFILIGGFNKKSIVAIIGTMLGIVAAGLIAVIFQSMTHLTALNIEKGTQFVYLALEFGIKVKGLLFAAILIGSMGAVMDVSMSIASSMQEMLEVNPRISRKQLIASGMTIGKDIMGTMANTLILAFMGGSLGLILILWGYNMAFRQLINMPFLAVELIQGLAGSIGVILTVPFTAYIAGLIYMKRK